jgi:hypothetical protein
VRQTREGGVEGEGRDGEEERWRRRTGGGAQGLRGEGVRGLRGEGVRG